MERKLLITGGGYADIPIVKAAKQLGFYVITSGLDENGLGNLYSDLYCKADNSDKEAIFTVAEKLKVDAICPSAAGLSGVSCSYASERLGFKYLDPYSTAKILHYKDSFLKFAKENNILSPKAESFSEINIANEAIAGFSFPLIVKPADLSGGKGIVKVANKEEAKTAILNAFNKSKTKTVIIEEFIEGTNHGFSTIIKDGKVVFYFSDNEYYYLNKYTVAGASTPGDVPQEAIDILISEIEKIAAILRLKNGIFHLQFIFKKNKPYIIDICRRIPGDLYVDFVKYATGVDYPSFIVKAFVGMSIDDLKQKSSTGYYTRHVIMSKKNGRFKNIYFDDMIVKNIIDKFIIIKENNEIVDFMTQRVGIVFLKYSSKKELDGKNKRIQELIKVEVDD